MQRVTVGGRHGERTDDTTPVPGTGGPVSSCVVMDCEIPLKMLEYMGCIPSSIIRMIVPLSAGGFCL